MIPYHLNSNKADIGITANTSASLVGRRTPIFSEALHLIGPSKSFLQSRTTVALDDVSKLPLLLPMMEGTRKLYNEAMSRGFKIASSSPFTRSSFHAEDDFKKLKKLEFNA